MNIIKLSENQIVNQYQGFDLYYDRQDKILYSTPTALARWIGCGPRTVKKVVGNLGLGKTATIPTTQGLKKGNLLTSAEVIKILEALANSKRTKKETRKSASSKITTMAQVGYELTGMLAIAEISKLSPSFSIAFFISQPNSVSHDLPFRPCHLVNNLAYILRLGES